MSSLTYADVFRRLDAAAEANLSSRAMSGYERLKAQLIHDEDSPKDVEAILTGFIWGNIEEEADG